jgi:hypothetical protein
MAMRHRDTGSTALADLEAKDAEIARLVSERNASLIARNQALAEAKHLHTEAQRLQKQAQRGIDDAIREQKSAEQARDSALQDVEDLRRQIEDLERQNSAYRRKLQLLETQRNAAIAAGAGSFAVNLANVLRRMRR